MRSQARGRLGKRKETQHLIIRYQYDYPFQSLGMDMGAFHRDDWKFLDTLKQPTYGRRLDVGGFVLGDSFDTFLRNISEDYLQAAWTRLSAVMTRHSIICDDLSWGWMQSGETGLPNADGVRVDKDTSSPSDFIGWTSCDLSEIWRTEECHRLDMELKVGEPSLRCTATWRSLKWSIAPEDYQLALKLIEYICLEDVSSWNPLFALENIAEPTEIWLKMAEAIRDSNQQPLDVLVDEARQAYSPLGFRIVIQGYKTYLYSGVYEGKVTLSELV